MGVRSQSLQIVLRDAVQKERPNILTQCDPPPVELSDADIRWQIVAGRSETVQWSQWIACRKPPSLFRMVRSTTLYDLPFPEKWGSQINPSWYRISNGHISTGHPIHFMFRSRIGFSGLADRMAPFPVRTNSRWRHLGIFEWPYIRNAWSDPLHVWFYRVWFSSSADRMMLFFRFDQIQDGCQPPSWEITAASRGFPATARPSCIHKAYITMIHVCCMVPRI